ncbi:unnamed protein product [Bursaphelenchus xylophilus]|uniref:Protein kish n=1 Tax=Bursaphelenchus xylophilus TaxID=6326 RepID=A0A811LTS0_BURXY|nr:unnamed protein product [Bursaphelenchus xylophilus]CAG9121029.1 unnamed protein product [Bursaphelenchus xylophilus]
MCQFVGFYSVKLSAIFSLQGLLSVLLLLICTCAYIRSIYPRIIDYKKEGIGSVFWKCARIGERLSLWVAAGCFLMAGSLLFL